MSNQSEYKLSSFQIEKLKKSKIKILKNEEEHKEHIKKQKENLKTLYMAKLFDYFNDYMLEND